MKNNKNKFIYIVILTLVCSLSLVGCQAARRPSKTTPKSTKFTTPVPTPATPKSTTPMTRTTPTNPATPTNPTTHGQTNKTVTPSSLSTRASNVTNAINKVKGVNRSTIVISGNDALVGISQKADYSTKDMDMLKKNVANTVKTADKGVKNVYVTTDAGLYKRIEKVAKDVSGGKTLTTYTDEIANIIKKIGK